MRRTRWVAVALCLLVARVPARADDAAEARALLDKAIKAMGGKDKLAKLRATTCKTKGTIQVNELKIEFDGEWSGQGEERARWSLDVQVEGRSESGVVVLNKDKGWVSGKNGNAQDLTKQKGVFDVVRNEFRTMQLLERLTPLTDKAYQLSPLGELKINDRAAVGIKVTHKGRPDIDLFFDKETGLPVRGEFRVQEPEGQEVLHAFYFADYKEFDGVKHFTKLTLRRDDKPFIEMELSEVKLQEMLDDGTFDKP